MPSSGGLSMLGTSMFLCSGVNQRKMRWKQGSLLYQAQRSKHTLALKYAKVATWQLRFSATTTHHSACLGTRTFLADV